MQPNLSSIRNARELLARHFSVTRLVDASYLGEASGKTVSLKLETELPTGSFKVRGALYALVLKLEQTPIQEVVAWLRACIVNHRASMAGIDRLYDVVQRAAKEAMDAL